MGRTRADPTSPLLKGMRIINGRYYYLTTTEPRQSFPLGGTFSEALKAYEVVAEQAVAASRKKRMEPYLRIYRSSIANARTRGITHELTWADMESLVNKAHGKCTLTSIPFDLSAPSKQRRPWAPSIDRIDSSKGYSLENCRLVVVAANLAMNRWGQGVLLYLAQHMAGKL